MLHDLWAATAVAVPLTASLLLSGKPRVLAWLLCLVPAGAIALHAATAVGWFLPIACAMTVLTSLLLLLWEASHARALKASFVGLGLTVLALMAWLAEEAAATLVRQNPDLIVCVDPSLYVVHCAIDNSAVYGFALSLWGLLAGSVFGAVAETLMLALLILRSGPPPTNGALSPPSARAP